MAFGTGLHPTTRLCLEALEARADRGPLGRVLDVGCGSGILSIAAVKLGATRALGVDIDPIAIEATLANARHNRVGKRVRAREGSVPDRRRPVRHGPRQPHRGRARRASRRISRRELVPGGTLIALGHLHRPGAGGRGRRSRRAGLEITGRRHETDWVALEAVRPADAAEPADRADRHLQSAAMPPVLFPVLLVAHIALAIAAVRALAAAALRLPRAARLARPERVRAGSCGSCWRSSRGAPSGSASGSRSPASGSWRCSGSSVLQQPWLLVALAIYALNLGLAYFIQVPRLRSLIGLRSTAATRAGRTLARRQRYISYVMAGLVGTIGFLMSTKPALW